MVLAELLVGFFACSGYYLANLFVRVSKAVKLVECRILEYLRVELVVRSERDYNVSGIRIRNGYRAVRVFINLINLIATIRIRKELYKTCSMDSTVR